MEVLEINNAITQTGSLIVTFPNVSSKNIKSLNDEEWKRVPIYGGIYYASNKGRAKSILALAIHNGKATKIEQRLLEVYPNRSTGYATTRVYKDGVWTGVTIHRLVALAFIPNPENKPQVNHKNGNKGDNFLENLEWCTASENTNHAYDTSLSTNCGETHYKAKLTNQSVTEIKKKYSQNNTIKELGMEYGVHAGTIHDIVNNKTWKRNGSNL